MLMGMYCIGMGMIGLGLGQIGAEIEDGIAKRKKQRTRQRIETTVRNEVERIKTLSSGCEQLEARLRLERYLRDELIFHRDPVYILEMHDLIDANFPSMKRK